MIEVLAEAYFQIRILTRKKLKLFVGTVGFCFTGDSTLLTKFPFQSPSKLNSPPFSAEPKSSWHKNCLHSDSGTCSLSPFLQLWFSGGWIMKGPPF